MTDYVPEDDKLDTLKYGQTDLRSNYQDIKLNFAILSEVINSYNPTLVRKVLSFFNYYPILRGTSYAGFEELFWNPYRLQSSALDHTDLSLQWFASGGGMVVAKSDWTNTATSVSFRSGDRVDGHQDLDANSFTIYSHGGDLEE